MFSIYVNTTKKSNTEQLTSKNTGFVIPRYHCTSLEQPAVCVIEVVRHRFENLKTILIISYKVVSLSA